MKENQAKEKNMKKLFISALLLTLITACGTANETLPPLELTQPEIVQTNADKNSFESFKGFVSKSKYENKLIMLMKVKALVRSHEDTYYEIRFSQQNDKTETILTEGTIRFAKDGTLYLEDYTNDKKFAYYRLGTYKTPNIKIGTPVDFKIDNQYKLKIHWRTVIPGLSSFDNQRIMFMSNVKDIKPEIKIPTDLI
jgi:hypothetical protein